MSQQGDCPPMYPVTLDLEYRVISARQNSIRAYGKTAWISSQQLTFTGDQAVKTGDRMEVSVFWPVKLEGRIKLQLVVRGRAVGVSANRITMSIKKHEFRTLAIGRLETSASSAEPALVPAGSGNLLKTQTLV